MPSSASRLSSLTACAATAAAAAWMMVTCTATLGCGKAKVAPDGSRASDARGDTSSDQGEPGSFTIRALAGVGIGSENSTGWANIGQASAMVDWQSGPFARATLIVDLESSCYPFESWALYPPPPGHNWPTTCDAFDRNFNVFIDSGDRGDASTEPPFEVIHAITPFGGPARVEADITDLVNARPGPHRLRIEIRSYSDPAGVVTGANAGWTVTARIELTPGTPPRKVLAAIPLFVGKVEAADAWPVISFESPDGTAAGRLEYRTSGHGQGAVGPRCIGPAEEFCDRRHQVHVDGLVVKDISAYREDCASLCTLTHQGPAGGGFNYCLENPGGLPASVRASRANWCPGSMTPPLIWDDIPALGNPGTHTVSFQVSQIAAGGHWLMSAAYFAYAL